MTKRFEEPREVSVKLSHLLLMRLLMEQIYYIDRSPGSKRARKLFGDGGMLPKMDETKTKISTSNAVVTRSEKKRQTARCHYNTSKMTPRNDTANGSLQSEIAIYPLSQGKSTG
ncbi:unnamed protein product [Soboliphyme baturini]|uniref:Ovule protein n=1 Tax=Soboliphyme baturini TaxID=241478 RepID=A0A183IXZ9_9BILA|nr:unnamed protein product [Soboliphyme baturini]